MTTRFHYFLHHGTKTNRYHDISIYYVISILSLLIKYTVEDLTH